MMGKIAVPHLTDITLNNRPNLSDDELRYLERGAANAVSNFPDEACQVATDELLHRIGYGEIINGSYQLTGRRAFNDFWPHEFLDVGKTSLADRTILDITADQFGGPAIYIGEWIRPWSTLEDLQQTKHRALQTTHLY
jgi:hypothetical protein